MDEIYEQIILYINKNQINELKLNNKNEIENLKNSQNNIEFKKENSKLNEKIKITEKENKKLIYFFLFQKNIRKKRFKESSYKKIRQFNYLK